MEVTNRRRAIVVGILVVIAVVGLAFLITSLIGAQDTDPYPVQNGSTFNATGGPTVIIGDDQADNITSGDPFDTNRTVDLHPYGSVSSTGPTSVIAYGVNSSWTDLDEISLNGNTLTADISNKQQIDLSGGVENISYREMTIADGSTDFDINVSSTAQVTVHGLTNGEVVTAWNTDGGDATLQDFDTVEGGSATFDVADSGSVELRGTNSPTVDDSTATPTGQLSEQPDEFSIDVSHPDFPGISATVEVFVNGNSVGTTTVNQNGTATVTDGELPADGGSNDWHVVVTDEYGNSVQSDTHTFSLPDELRIYQEGAPNTLVNSTTTDLTFYYQQTDRVFEKSTSSGILDMGGMPVSEDVVIVARADGYEDRRIYLDSIVDQANIYLLSNQTASVASQFTISDFTGRFPDDETVLKVQRNLNGNWTTVLGDYFGASGQFSAQLAQDERHRLILLNTETGRERDLGVITPTTDQGYTIEVTADDALIIAEDLPTISIDPQTRSLQARETASVSVNVNEMDKTLDHWNVTVSVAGETIVSESLDGPSGGTLTPTLNLSGHEGDEVTVDVTVVSDDGSTLTKTATYTIREYYDHDGSLLSVLGNWGGALGNATTLIAVFATAIISGALARKRMASTESVGAVALASLASFNLIGWVPLGLVFAGGVTFATMFAIRRGL